MNTKHNFWKFSLPGFMEYPLKKGIEMLPPLKDQSRSFYRNQHTIKKIILIESGGNMEKVWFSNPDFCPAPERLKWESNGLILFIKTSQERTAIEHQLFDNGHFLMCQSRPSPGDQIGIFFACLELRIQAIGS
jgi:hypothetical protein